MEKRRLFKKKRECLSRSITRDVPPLYFSHSLARPNKVSKCNTRRITHAYINTRIILSIDDRILSIFKIGS